ncbi:MAG: hypothetical protein WBF67_09670, partial [Olleya sp.]
SAFNYDLPVGLRINSNEIKNDTLNVGYSALHDHLLRPEVSRYLATGKDTIWENHFDVYLNKNNNFNQFKTSDIEFFTDYKAIISFKKNHIILKSPSNIGYESKTIKFIRVKTNFTKDNYYPNPIYSYIRNTLLAGNYTLKDSINNTLSDNFKISDNGIILGYEPFKNKYIHYSTDIYCGPPQIDELVLIHEKIKSYDFDSLAYVFKLIDKNTIYLYKRYPRYKYQEESRNIPNKEDLGKESYRLIRK